MFPPLQLLLGTCCLGVYWKNQTHELQPAHKCERCNEIVHLLCDEVENADLPKCFSCLKKPEVATDALAQNKPRSDTNMTK